MSLIATNTVKIKIKKTKERYLIKQDNTVYKLSIKLLFFKYRTRQIKATEKIRLDKGEGGGCVGGGCVLVALHQIYTH